MAIFTAIISLVGAVGAFVGSLGFFGQALVSLAIGAGLSFASSLLTPRPKQPTLPRFDAPSMQYQAVVNQSVAPRRRGYGRVKVGGVRAFFDSRSGFLWQIVMIHSGRIDALEEYWLGDTQVDLDGSSIVANGSFAGYVLLTSFDGTDDQAAWGALVSAFPEWTADHRLRGIAYIGARFTSPPTERYLEIFPEGFNTAPRAIIRASRVLDTRTGAFAWSENPAMILRDYLTHPDGYRRLTDDDIDVTSFNAFADLCDELVPLAAGGTEKRYRCWGLYELNDDPTQVIGRILATCDGELYTTGEGRVAIRGGAWAEPTVTIEARSIIGHDLEEGADALDRFNQLKIVFTSPELDYQPTEATAWDDLADQAVRGVQAQDLTIDMCPSPAQARRLAKITIAKSNPRWRGVVRTNLAGLAAVGERVIRLVVPELQINGSFLVTSHRINFEGALPTGCEIGVSALDASAYAWSVEEEGQNPAVPQDTRPIGGLPVPAGLSLVVDRRAVTEATTISIVEASVTPPDREDLRLEAQIRLVGGSIWEGMTAATGEFLATSGAVIDGAQYEVRARFGTSGAVGDWTGVETITVVANPSPPAAPGSFTATRDGADVDLAWINPGSNHYRARVYRGSSATFSAAAQIAEIGGFAGAESEFRDEDPGEGTWVYWVTSRNESGVEGPPAGPREIVIT